MISDSLDDREAELLSEIDRRREDLIQRAEAFRRNALMTIDPREKVRQHPVGGTFASLAAGMMVALIPRRRAAQSASDDGSKGVLQNPLLNVVLGLLPGLLPSVLPVLVGPLMALLGRSSGAGKAPSSR